MSSDTQTSRRDLFKLAAVAGAAGLLPGIALGSPAAQPPLARERKRVLRLAHLTDIHVQPELRAGEGMSACLRHVEGQKEKPDLILTGGDMVMDAFEADEARTRLQWDLFHKVLKENTSIPVEHCIGNHDIWGWNKAKSKTAGNEARWGKAWALEAFGIEKRYRSFEKAGWKFIVLDSVQPSGDGYTAHLDEEQRAWFEGELKANAGKKPTLVLSHIPILSIGMLANTETRPGTDHKISGGLNFTDAAKIKTLFHEHGGVKLCLSGHLHLVDRVDYLGVTYLCNGAVSGGWWKGKHREFSEGYAIVDLFDDGTFEHQYVEYGWQAQKGPA